MTDLTIWKRFNLWRFIPFVVRRNIRPSNLPYAIKCYRIAPKGKKWMTFKWAMKL